MKVILPDPMNDRRASATAEVNAKFSRMVAQASYLESVHARKRQIAQAVMDGLAVDEGHPFAAEATLRGLPVAEFARDVVSKPDVVLASDLRELQRQTILLKIDGAKTPGEVAEILHEYFPQAETATLG